jgi:hypothetical protein
VLRPIEPSLALAPGAERWPEVAPHQVVGDGLPVAADRGAVGDTREDIVRSFEQYRAGTFQRY